eukprot:4939461-Amphidinium_carterae.1
MKAFLDVGAENPLVKARYNAAGFLKHQLRVCVNNTFDSTAEPTREGGQGTVSFKSFFKMVEVAFPPGVNPVDAKAMLKRATWIIFAERVYIRVADIGERPVPAYEYPLGEKDLLKPDCKSRMAAYKEGSEWEPDHAGMTWSKNFVKEYLNKKDEPGAVRADTFGWTPCLSATLAGGGAPSLNLTTDHLPPMSSTGSAQASTER